MGTSGLPEELHRLKEAYNAAVERHAKALDVVKNAHVDLVAQRTAFFEKIAIGAGATIAALVSFLGTHAGTLHPHWILRIALVFLAIATIAALYRNFRYPLYSYSANSRKWLAALTNVEQHYNAIFNPERLSDTTLEDMTAQEAQREGSVWREVTIAEEVCLIAVCVTVLALVVLAWCNF